MKKQNQQIDDPLWKSIIEQTFAHFLLFFFPNAAEIFDFSKGFIFLDKEFESLFPPESSHKGVRYVDKLVKVSLRDSGQQYILCHIEVQSSKSKEDFPLRMYTYFYRIGDKHKVSIIALAILADLNKSYHPKMYKKQFLGTSLIYKFNTYKIIDQDEAELRANPNPFAVVILTVFLALKNRNITDLQLLDLKHDLYDELQRRKADRKTRKGIYDFLLHYVSFQNQAMFGIFEKAIEIKTGRSTTMGTREYLLEKAKKTGIQQGIEKGVQQGLEKGILIEREKALQEKKAIAWKLKDMGLPLAEIANIINVELSMLDEFLARS